MGFRKTMLIWSGVFTVITISVLFLGKIGFTSDNTEEKQTVVEIDNTHPSGVSKNIYSNILETPIIDTMEKDTDSQTIDDNLIKSGKSTQKYVEDDSTNILFVGSDNLTGLYDTIGILSIAKSDKALKVVMIPRDLHIDYSSSVRDCLDNKGKNRPDFYKINSAHYIGTYMKYEGKFNTPSIDFLSDVIKEKLGITVNDYINVNTAGFVEIVNLFGGVDVDVPYNMLYKDPFQDLCINLNKGIQHLNGKQAEGFVRFRQYYDSNGKLHNLGDYERKKNQINFIKSFIKQHGTINNIDKLPKLLGTLSKNVKHSIGFGDILKKYVGLSKDVISKKYEVESITISGRDQMINGTYYIVLTE